MTSPPRSSLPSSAASPTPGTSAPALAEAGPAADLEQVRAYYDDDPDREWQRTRSGPYHRLEFEVIHRAVLPGVLAPASRILDIGCGPGRHAVALAAQGHYVQLADLSAACLAAARRRIADAGLSGQLLGTQNVSAACLDVVPGSYDAVLLFGPLYHLTDDADARASVQRAAAALRPGGHLLAIFLTRTSVIRDLIKRGRFTEIRALLDSGYLSHGRYRPLSAGSRADYMPPARTHRLAEARDLLGAAGLEITAVHSLEGPAAWMRPYVDAAAVGPAAFEELSAVVRDMTELPELAEAGDHYLVTARRPARPGGDPAALRAAAGPGRPRTVMAAGGDRICFAPATAVHSGRRLLAVATGAAADRVFVPRQPGQPGAEPWYAGGRNQLRIVALPGDGGRAGDHAGWLVPAPPGTRDMTGASLVSDGGRLRLWFSARAAAGPWRIYHAASADGGRTWSSPAVILEPGPPGATDSEHVLLPSALRRGDEWWMWYAGRDGLRRRIHLARSADGITWRRHGVALGLGGPGSPDAYAADCPAAAAAPGGQVILVYGAGTSRSLAAAVSPDGLTWRKLGPVVHRGAPGAADSRYAFYPALLAAGGGRAELLYAGEDDQGRWTVLSAGVLDLGALAGRPSPVPHSAALDGAVTRIRAEAAAEFLAEPADCHGPAPAWQSPDGAIRQLRPSSTPVFAVDLGERALVVKLGRGRAFAEREFDGAQVLARHLPVSAACLHYQGDDAAVVTEHVPGTPLSALAAADPGRFGAVLADATARLAAAAAATLIPAGDAAAADRTLQTPAVLAGWTDDIAAALAPWLGCRLRIGGHPPGAAIGDIIATSRRLSARPPAALSYGTGDLHLGNIQVAPGSRDWTLLDLEFAGWHDLDYAIAGLLGSCLKHAGLITGAAAASAGSEIRITTGLAGEWGHRLLDTPWLLGRFDALPTDPARVFALILPGLRFRLAPEDAGGALPAAGLAALALAARMTGQDQS